MSAEHLPAPSLARFHPPQNSRSHRASWSRPGASLSLCARGHTAATSEDTKRSPATGRTRREDQAGAKRFTWATRRSGGDWLPNVR